MSSYVEAAPGQNEVVFRCPNDLETGQWEPIEHIKDDKYVQEIGRFAVMEHNKQTGAHLKFICVEGGEKQVVNGMNYRLKLIAANGGLIWTYETMVYDNASERSWKLIYFVPLIKN